MFPYICKVKKKQAIFNFSLMIVVLFSMLFQSFHSYKHLSKELSQEICHHKYSLHKTEFTHQHNGFDHCFICEFTFSNYIPTEFSFFEFKLATIPTGYSYYYSSENSQYFKGSFFSLRAPPSNIV